jgi:CheY-like chemotaxis protein
MGPTRAVQRTTRRRILVCDDEPALASMVCPALSDFGDAEIATSARDAATRLDGRVPWDVVLMDVHLGDGDGIDTLLHGKWRGRIIVFSKDHQAETINRASELHATFHVVFLAKPFSDALVRARVAELLSPGLIEAKVDEWVARYHLEEHPRWRDVMLLKAKGWWDDDVCYALRHPNCDGLAVAMAPTTLATHRRDIIRHTGDSSFDAMLKRLYLEIIEALSVVS